MNATDAPDREAMIALSRRYSVASPVTAFVVFEFPQDYISADVPPPSSLGKDRYAQYLALKKQSDADEAKARKDRLDTVASLWDAQKDWWAQTFKPGKPKKGPLPRPVTLRDRETAMDVAAPVPNAPPPDRKSTRLNSSHT